MEGLIREGRSLAETPTWSVATVTTVMVFMCLLVQRSLYKFGRWLKKTRRKALLGSVEKIKEEDYGIKEHIQLRTLLSLNETPNPQGIHHRSSQHCGEGREPFVSHEGLE